MANIFKTTLKKDVIADIVSNNKREIRFPITKFWASRFTSEYNLNDMTFIFKSFDSLELSSPSNKDTDGMTYIFDFVRTFVDGNEFVIEFKEHEKNVENRLNDVCEECIRDIKLINDDALIELNHKDFESGEYIDSDSDSEIEYISNEEAFDLIKQWFDESSILNSLYESEFVFATNARQIIILPKGRVLGFKKTLPLNNDNGLRVEFDMHEKIYFDATPDFDIFEDEIYKRLEEIRKNNFVFIWKRNTGIFMENDGRIYFGMKYSTRKSIGFGRKYNVQ